MSIAEAAIPYEMQSDSQTNRTCGAACLSMIYRSFGKEVPQAEIWPTIAKINQFGSLASTTHLMAQDALSRDFSALALQTRHPLQTLRLCHESGIRVIMNHRLNHQSSAGHFTVLVNIDDKDVFLHDPFFGPSRRMSHAELIELWQPRFPDSEIAGNVLIGIAVKPPETPACDLCHTPIPRHVECPACKKPVGLEPSALLGCVNNACIARMWNFLCCPSCDYTWTFSLRAPAAGAAAPGAGSSAPGVSSSLSPNAKPVPPAGQDLLNFDEMFAEMDKFCRHVLSLPAAANHPEIKRYMELLATRKEQLKQAQAQTLTHLKTHQEQMAKMAQETKQRQDAHRKKMEEVNRPSAPLDGNALGHALLKNLGFRD
jgi:hypothetical protein